MIRIKSLIRKLFINFHFLSEDRWFKLSPFELPQDNQKREWELTKVKLETLDDSELIEIIENILDTKNKKNFSSLYGLFLAWEIETDVWPNLSSVEKQSLVNLVKMKFYEGIDFDKFKWIKKRLKKMDLLQLLYIYVSVSSENSIRLFIINNYVNIIKFLNLITKIVSFSRFKKFLIKNILKHNFNKITEEIINFYEAKF